MEVKVVLNYEVDGRAFKSAEEALAYAQSGSHFRMYTETGERTYCAEEASILYLPDEESVEAFFKECEENGGSWDGLFDDCIGWWYRGGDEYEPIPLGLVDFFIARGANLND